MRKWNVSKFGLGGFLGAVAAVFMFATTASAQVERPSQVSIQGTALITKTSDGTDFSHETTKSGGFLVGYSYQFHRWAGVEANYGYSRNLQKFSTLAGQSAIQPDIHEFTGAFVAHLPVNALKVRPYALAGAGALLFDPTDNIVVAGVGRQTKATFVYGGGVNFDVARNVGVRAEYRGLVYKVPDFTINSLNIDKVTHLAQPSVGIFFRF